MLLLEESRERVEVSLQDHNEPKHLSQNQKRDRDIDTSPSTLLSKLLAEKVSPIEKVPSKGAQRYQ